MENYKHKKRITPVEELLKKIQGLEDDHVHLKHKMFNLIISRCLQISNFPPPSDLVPCQGTILNTDAASSSLWKCPPLRRVTRCTSFDCSNLCWTMHSGVKLKEAWYFNIFQSIDQPIHMLDANGRVIYRNRAWEDLYGYNTAETLGKPVTELLFEPKDVTIASDILQKMLEGGSWTGEFPVKNKKGKRFLIFGSTKPLRDENGKIAGIICTSALPCLFQETELEPSIGAPRRLVSQKLALDPQQPIQSASALKISDSVDV